MVRVMVTDGNNVHAPDYHAEVTAEKITILGENASPEIVSATRALRKKIENILLAHHQNVHDSEQAALASEGAARHGTPLDSSGLVDVKTVQEIATAAVGTPLEQHFARADVQAAILEELHHETRSQMNVHRLVHARAAELAKS